MSGERDVLERLLDYDSCHDGDVDDAVVEIRSLRRQVATLREACRELIEHAEWDGTTDAAAAIERARAALAETEETPEC